MAFIEMEHVDIGTVIELVEPIRCMNGVWERGTRFTATDLGEGRWDFVDGTGKGLYASRPIDFYFRIPDDGQL